MGDFVLLILGTVGALLPIVNPLSAVPVFVSVTRRFPAERRAQQARRAATYMAVILLTALLAGALILSFFGISLYALRVAGGLVIARLGLGMLRSDPGAGLSAESEREVQGMEDVAFTPIAMPLLSGPGSIAVTIAMATQADRTREFVAVGLGILLMAALSWLLLRASGGVSRVLGPTGTDAMARIMGFLLTCIGVQFIASGIYEAFLDPEVLGPLLEAIRAAGPS